MLHPVAAGHVQGQLGAGDVNAAGLSVSKVQVCYMLQAGYVHRYMDGLVGDQNDLIVALDLPDKTLHIRIHMDAHAVGNDFGIDAVVVVDTLVDTDTPAFRIVDDGAGGIGVVGADAQTVGHQLLDLLGCGFTVGDGKAHLRIGGLGSLYKVLHAFPLGSRAPHANEIRACGKQRLIVLRNGIQQLGLLHTLHVVQRTVVLVDVGTFHIDAGDGSAFRGSHGFADLLEEIQILRKRHAC